MQDVTTNAVVESLSLKVPRGQTLHLATVEIIAYVPAGHVFAAINALWQSASTEPAVVVDAGVYGTAPSVQAAQAVCFTALVYDPAAHGEHPTVSEVIPGEAVAIVAPFEALKVPMGQSTQVSPVKQY